MTSGCTVWYLDNGKIKLHLPCKGRPFSRQGGVIPPVAWVPTFGSMGATAERYTAERTWRTFASLTLKIGHGQRYEYTSVGVWFPIRQYNIVNIHCEASFVAFHVGDRFPVSIVCRWCRCGVVHTSSGWCGRRLSIRVFGCLRYHPKVVGLAADRSIVQRRSMAQCL